MHFYLYVYLHSGGNIHKLTMQQNTMDVDYWTYFGPINQMLMVWSMKLFALDHLHNTKNLKHACIEYNDLNNYICDWI